MGVCNVILDSTEMRRNLDYVYLVLVTKSHKVEEQFPRLYVLLVSIESPLGILKWDGIWTMYTLSW